MNADIWDFQMFMTSHFNINVSTSCNRFTQIRMTASGWRVNPPPLSPTDADRSPFTQARSCIKAHCFQAK